MGASASADRPVYRGAPTPRKFSLFCAAIATAIATAGHFLFFRRALLSRGRADDGGFVAPHLYSILTCGYRSEVATSQASACFETERKQRANAAFGKNCPRADRSRSSPSQVSPGRSACFAEQ